MQKNILVSLVALILIGCGGKDEPAAILPTESTTTTTQSSTQQRTFGIKDTKWSIGLPTGWSFVAPPSTSTSTVILARRDSGNFVILQKTADTTVPSVQNFIDKAKTDFHSFSLLEQENTQWSFSGQLETQDPVRNFYQKILLIPGTNNYLYGSCSHEISQDYSADCKALLNSWNPTAS